MTQQSFEHLSGWLVYIPRLMFIFDRRAINQIIESTMWQVRRLTVVTPYHEALPRWKMPIVPPLRFDTLTDKTNLVAEYHLLCTVVSRNTHFTVARRHEVDRAGIGD